MSRNLWVAATGAVTPVAMVLLHNTVSKKLPPAKRRKMRRSPVGSLIAAVGIGAVAAWGMAQRMR